MNFLIGQKGPWATRLNFVVAVSLSLVTANVLGGAPEVLKAIPQDVAAVILLPTPRLTAERLAALRLDLAMPCEDGAVIGLLEQHIGLCCVTHDVDRPAALVFLHSSRMDRPSALVAYRSPAAPPLGEDRPKADQSRPERSDSRTTGLRLLTRKIGEQNRYFAVREGLEIEGASRRDVRRLLRQRSKTLAARLSAESAAAAEGADFVLYLPASSWRTQMASALALLRVLSGTMSGGAPDDVGKQVDQVVTNWMFDGTARVLADLEFVTLSVRLNDGGGLRLTHRLEFRRGGAVSEYLSRVERSDRAPWSGIPQRPFVGAVSVNWRCPAGASLGGSMLERLFEAPALTAEVPVEQRATLLRRFQQFEGRMESTTWLVDVDERSRLQLIGAYHLPDSQEAFRELTELSQSCARITSVLVPGLGVQEGLRSTRRGNLEVHEFRLDASNINPADRAAVEGLYGPSPVCQIAAVAPDVLGYQLSQDDELLESFGRALSDDGRRFSDDPRVAGLIRVLPLRPHVLAMLDVGRLIEFAPRLVALSTEIDQCRERPSVEVGVGLSTTMPADAACARVKADGRGPLVGWALTVSGTAIQCEAYVSRKDALRSVSLLRDFAKQMARPGEHKGRGAFEVKVYRK